MNSAESGDSNITLHFTEHEASCLSLACLFSRSQTYPRPALESAREKIRAGLNKPDRKPLDDGERYVALEC